MFTYWIFAFFLVYLSLEVFSRLMSFNLTSTSTAPSTLSALASALASVSASASASTSISTVCDSPLLYYVVNYNTCLPLFVYLAVDWRSKFYRSCWVFKKGRFLNLVFRYHQVAILFNLITKCPNALQVNQYSHVYKTDN